ncbi:MAG TPA: L-seryl-tRNA(Sec) selenium transferase [Pyrinomonadaceae bacterium]|nr:L-seryl-tRNA(Sec) selenium transferase [Pyrinomonadaceae bacterium]
MADETRNMSALRALPSVDALLRTPEARLLAEQVGAERLTILAREVTNELRSQLQAEAQDAASGNGSRTREALVAEAVRRLELACEMDARASLRRVINATGVILHTNLGRAPLSEAARRAVAYEAARYCTLEYDLEAGSRGRRGAQVERLLAELTGAESALVVNNCAAAALLVLTALSKGGTAIVSRGELVEIGGDFRVPDVMAESGTRLVEVGTTNRTKLADYERAIDADTRLLMRVHTSNYRIVGFTSTPSLSELARLAHDAGLPLYEDAGSGALLDLGGYGLEGEPVIGESIRSGADVVTFSGDKLLGGAQAGIVVGREEIIERLRRHPLYRALRADKLALAALQATLEIYRRGAHLREIPVLRALSLSPEELATRARSFVSRLSEQRRGASLRFEVIEGESAIGGGAAPTARLGTSLIALSHDSLAPDALGQLLRRNNPPVVARIAEDRLLLDLRTVAEDEEAELLNALVSLTAA